MGLGKLFGMDNKDGRKAAKVMNAELKRQYNITKQDYQPFTDMGKKLLPSLIEQSTNFSLEGMRDPLNDFLAPIIRDRVGAGAEYMAAMGLDPSLADEIGQIDADQYLPMLLGAESDQYANLLGLVGVGQDKATELAAMGQQYGSQIAGNTMQGALADQQANAQGFSNMLKMGLGAFMLSGGLPAFGGGGSTVGDYGGIQA